MILLAPLSQNFPVAAIEALVLMAIAAYIGWWLGRRTFNAQIDGLRTSIALKSTELNDCRRTKVVPFSSNNSTAAKAAGFAAAGSTTAASDDLKIVEGIGPKIEELLNNAGIKTFTALASTSSNHITDILRAAGPHFRGNDPTTWAAQAQLAADGQWDKLKAWQDELNKGKEM